MCRTLSPCPGYLTVSIPCSLYITSVIFGMQLEELLAAELGKGSTTLTHKGCDKRWPPLHWAKVSQECGACTAAHPVCWQSVHRVWIRQFCSS